MSIELPENTTIKGEAGFTMIEIVMVLVLLGILGAVAVAKYFDLKEQASAIKCEHRKLFKNPISERWGKQICLN